MLGPGGARTIDDDEPVRWHTDFGDAELTHVNLYDRTVEGLRLIDVPGATVQYHPEAGPGPERRAVPVRPVRRRDPRGRLMPRRDDIHKILLIGSGPIVIGQAAEFDYSGTQACQVLLEEGYEVVLVNSNPATIMTDPELATTTYIEPLLPRPGAPGDRARAARRAAADARRPDRAEPRQGAARGRHARAQLGVELIGADYEAIDRAEDRERFRETMTGAGLRVPRSAIAHTSTRRAPRSPRSGCR